MSEQQVPQSFHQMELDGEVLGNHYILDKKIGQGGMAWVYQATHKLLGGNVAVKILFPQLAENENIRLRFLREARIQYQLEHPNIVRVLDLLEERGLVGFVSEWCSGGDLVHWMKAHQLRPLESGEIRSLFLPLLNAIHLAHESNVVHRDLKPHNIMLHQRGELLIPKLTDFGVAKQASEQGLTATGMVVGTVHYMSPEQLYESRSVDHRSDIFSLGVILYQLASGKLPFVGETPSIFMKILEAEPEPIPHLPGPLNDIIQRCLAKKAEDRFANCLELQEALNLCLDPPLPILPFGKEITDTAMKQARAGFASSVSVLGQHSGSAPTFLPTSDTPLGASSAYSMPTMGAGADALPGKPAGKSGGGWGTYLFLLLFFGGLAGAGYWWMSIQKTTIVGTVPDASTPTQPTPRSVGKPPAQEPLPTSEPQVRDAGATSPPEKRTSAPEIKLLPPEHFIEHREKPIREKPIREKPIREKPIREKSVRRPRLSLSHRCRHGRGYACYRLGRKEVRKKHWAIDFRVARRFFRKACRLHVAKGCTALAFLWLRGKGGLRSSFRARRLFWEACHHNDAVACRELGWMYHKGRGVRRNTRLARSYYKRACRYRDSTGCNFLGLMYRQGLGGAHSHSRALRFYRKACRMKNNVGCFNVGVMYGKGWSGFQSTTRAYRFYQKSCWMRFGRACYSAAQALWKLRGKRVCRKINRLLRRACRLKFKSACRKSCASFRKRGGGTWLDDF